MTLDSGIITIKRLSVGTPNGGMPVESYAQVFKGYYGSRTVGYNRYFTAQQADERIDLLVRIQRFAARTSDIAELTPAMDDGTGGTYIVNQVQHLADEDGLPVTDLSLRRTEGVNEPYNDPIVSA